MIHEFHHLPKRLRKRYGKSITLPIVRICYNDIVNKLLSVQPLHESPGVRAALNFIMNNKVVLTKEEEKE
jgi:hypothetical protein